jgi:nucleoid-associated protein YgaU
MKRIMKLAVLALLVAIAGGLFAEGLADNQYLKKSLELQALSTKAFDAGDYDASAAYAKEARDWALRSDEYIAKTLADSKAAAAIAAAKDEAGKAIAAAQARYDWAVSVNAKVNYPKELDSATADLAAAKGAFGAADYAAAKAKAEAVIADLANVSESQPWPATYKVRLIPDRRDCLWRIAEYPFVYNDPLKWPLLYEANKKTFKDPSNPNLIFPGQVLTIPSVNGETRQGAYDPSKTYSVFPKVK